MSWTCMFILVVMIITYINYDYDNEMYDLHEFDLGIQSIRA